MKSIISWILVLAILISTFPRPASASEPPPLYFGPDQNHDSPIFPVLSAMSSAAAPNKLGIVSANIPFTIQTGEWFEFVVNFDTDTYRILDASGGTFGSGSLPAAQSAELEKALLDYRASQLATDDPEQKNWIIAGVVVGVIGIIVAAAYAEEARQRAIANQGSAQLQFEIECAATSANATAVNFANAAAACPMTVSRRGNQWCTTAATQTSSASGCAGAQYSCVTRCE